MERVIGLVRQKYTILQSTLPINLIASGEGENVSVIDKIVTVCSALCNCCDSVVVCTIILYYEYFHDIMYNQY